ncbi:PBS lyase [Calothrix sp. 336/3]|nr:PBS lyase [Calothrix sp. 336/3]
MLFLLWTGNSWAQMGDDGKITPIIEKLVDRDARIRLEAHDALVSVGSAGVPALIAALKSEDSNLRWRAAWVLGDIPTEASAAVGALIEALQDTDAQVRMYAALALGDIGKPAKSAVPALMAALQDREEFVRIYAAAALKRLGGEAKVAVPSLVNALKDKNPRVRKNAALALGAMGVEANSAVKDLIPLLDDEEYYVRYGVVKGLSGIIGAYQDVADNLPSGKLTKVICSFEQVLKILETHQDKFSELDTVKIRRPLEALKTEKETRLFAVAQEWVIQHKVILGVTLYVTLLPLLCLLLLWVAPLWILQINNALKPYTDFSLPLVSINVPLRYVLFVGFFHYHPRVLDGWVSKYMPSVREQFPKKETVSDRPLGGLDSSGRTYIPIPVILDGNTIPQLTPEALCPSFEKQRSCIVISGEGGIGKTSLACQLAGWAIAKDKRLGKHPILPVLLEENFRPVDGKSALLSAIRGQLQALIDEPEPICEELLIRLLRKKRILVIVDRFSELNASTRETIQLDSPDFPVNSLVITSRLEEKLARVNKTTIKPLRIAANKLSSFMEAYLTQRGKRDKFTDQEFFDACNRLSAIIGQGDITVLLAKLYAEQLISHIGTSGNPLPENIPSLMLGYLNDLNRDITEDKLDDRTIHQLGKIAAWECVQANYQPGAGKRENIITTLGNLNLTQPEVYLDYLENRLQLIQTVGTAKDQVRFCLDPLAEYLAALYIVEQCGDNDGKWRSLFFRKVDDIIKNGGIDSIKGFLLAVRESYMTQIPQAQDTDFLPQRLSKIIN